MTQVATKPRPRARRRPPPAPTLDDVQHIVLEDVSWDFYERLLKEIGNRPIRVTYDEGRLEMMSPLPEHEVIKNLIHDMMRLLTMELDMPMKCLGSTTFRWQEKRGGMEPDDCYYFRDEKRMRARKRWNPKRDPPPEIVVEVDVTRRSVDREPVYLKLGVPEIWRWDGIRLSCLLRRGEAYTPSARSKALPFLDPADLTRFLKMAWRQEENAILRQFLKWVKRQEWGSAG